MLNGAGIGIAGVVRFHPLGALMNKPLASILIPLALVLWTVDEAAAAQPVGLRAIADE